ncbi:MAG TPA: hypothetical protein VHZ03_14090 [Trebonia sp.]|nr:hypothetical protein [Trebonia sp.]
MTDAKTAAAVKSLARRIRTRDAAIRDGEDHADADVFALEFITAMRGHGWRHLAALAPPKATPVDEPGSGSSPRTELLAPVRAQMAELNAAKQPVHDEAGSTA